MIKKSHTIRKSIINKAGLILAEVIVAITLLIMAIIILGNLYHGAVSTTAISRNYLLSQNFVTEGFEAIKTLRDTNWIMHPNDESCWLNKNPQAEDCSSPSTNKELKVRINPGKGIWTIQTTGGSLDLEDPRNKQNSNFELSASGIGNVAKIYSFDSNVPANQVFDETIYYRSIKFLEIDPDNNYAIVEVKLQWKEGATVRTIIRQEALYNYFHL